MKPRIRADAESVNNQDAGSVSEVLSFVLQESRDPGAACDLLLAAILQLTRESGVPIETIESVAVVVEGWEDQARERGPGNRPDD